VIFPPRPTPIYLGRPRVTPHGEYYQVHMGSLSGPILAKMTTGPLLADFRALHGIEDQLSFGMSGDRSPECEAMSLNSAN
jgi:hypothetical protein